MRSIARGLAAFLIAAGVTLALGGAGLYLWGVYAQRTAERQWSDLAVIDPAPPVTARSKPLPKIQDGAIAKLWFPRLEQERYVLPGASRRNLARGPSWLEQTSLPERGGNCVIAGHRDTHFRMLKDVARGDLIVLEKPEGTFSYRVLRMQVVEPRNVSMLKPTTASVLTLVTCYPFYYVGPAPKRFIVRAELVETVLARASSGTDLPGARDRSEQIPRRR
jgi:sortase A